MDTKKDTIHYATIGTNSKQSVIFIEFNFSATMITDNEYVAVYKPLSFSSPGLCRYEVVSTNTTTTGTNKICLKPW